MLIQLSAFMEERENYMITYGSTTLTSYNTITKIEVYYYQSTSPTTQTGGSWSTTKPTWVDGRYVWQKIRTTYEGKLDNGSYYSESDPVNITGQQGKSGEAASSYKLTSSESAIALLKTGEYSTNQITFSATYKQGNNPIAPYNGGFVIQHSINGTEWVTDYTSLNNESSKTYTVPENILIIKCLLYQTKDCDELLDIVTVPIIKDGIDGTGMTNSFPIYLVSDKDKGITLDDHGWTRFKPSLDAENKYLWIDYISRYAEGNIKPQLIEKTGNKITFEYHGEKSPFESVIVDITPVQSGSGTPSSGNKRHISGWTSIDIGQADINLMPYEEGKYMLDLPEDIGTLDNQTLNLKNTMFTIQGDTLIIAKGDLGTHIVFPEEVDTVYGGKYNVITGVLMVTHGYIDKYNNEPLPSTWISDRDVYVKGTKPSVGAQVVFELNEPLIYELTPQEIMIFEHSNSIYASTGDISISYYDYQTTTSPYIDYALVSAFDASTAALEEATQLKQDFQELQEDIQTQLDQKVETWCQINDPALSWTTADLKQQHNGDLWYYIGESNMSYKNNTTYKYVASTEKWMPYAVSADLFDKIDTKTTIYYSQTTDTFSNVETGDYLVDSTDGSSYRYDGSKWVKVTDYKTGIDAAQASADTANDKIDNLEIGGRNLLSKANVLSQITAYTEENYIYTGLYGNGGGLKLPASLFEVGEKYVLSFKFKKISGTLTAIGGHCSGFSGYGNRLVVDGVKEESRYSQGHLMSDDSDVHAVEVYVMFNGDTSDNNLYIQPNRGAYTQANDNKFQIWDLQLEKGNRKTDWTPAPEDIENDIIEAKKTATNYMSSDNTGIMVADLKDGEQLPANAISGNVFITAGYGEGETAVDMGVHIRDGQEDLAIFGESTRIGKENDNNVSIDNNGIIINKGSKELAKYFSKGITFDEETPYKIGNDNSYITFEDTDSDNIADSLSIVADSIYFRDTANTNIKDTLNGLQSDLAIAQEDIDLKNNYIKINTSEPSIVISASSNTNDTNLKLESSQLSFQIDGQTTATITNDQMNIPTASVTNLFMQSTNTSTNTVYEKVWVMRTNGHLSLKTITRN